MTQNGSSDSADLMLFPLIFVGVLLCAAAMVWLLRRLFPRDAKRVREQSARIQVDEAVRRLEAAGIDPADLLGDWFTAIGERGSRQTGSSATRK
ncbi:MAG: hypothetical protein ABIS86_23185 [Streptosporangiaceae bacterium]